VTDRPVPAKSAEVRIGNTDRVGVLNVFDSKAVRKVNIDAESGTALFGIAGKNATSINPRQIIVSGNQGSEQFTASANSDDTRVDVGIQDHPGRFRVHGAAVSVTGAPVELTGVDGRLRLGRSGTTAPSSCSTPTPSHAWR
jgi:hypothetical protein